MVEIRTSNYLTKDKGQIGANPIQSPGHQEDGIFASNFGGLNTVVNPMSIPYNDSPAMQNVTVDLSGSIRKRAGTKITREEVRSASGVCVQPVSTNLGVSFQVAKVGKDILIYTTENDVTTLLMTKSNVFNSAAEAIRGDCVLTGEFKPRVIFTTGVNAPVQVEFLEALVTVTGTGATSVVFSNAANLANATTANIVLFQNGTRVTPSVVTYNGGAQTLTCTVPSYTGTYQYSVVLITWGWWAEAYHYFGYQVWQSVNRYNSVNTDQSVQIPSTLNNDIKVLGLGSVPYYPIYAYKSSTFNDVYNYDPGFNPSTANDWTFSNGAKYDYAAGMQCQPGPSFITFGAITGAVTVDMGLLRFRELRFNGGNYAPDSEILVYVNEVVAAQRNTSGAGTPWGGYSTAGSLLAPASGSLCPYMGFSMGNTVGLAWTDRAIVIHKTTPFVGSGASTSNVYFKGALEVPSDGAIIPAFGFGEFANYAVGSFPRSVTLCQGRLVFGGFPANGMGCVLSETYDTTVPGVSYCIYQVSTSLGLATDPFDVLITSGSDDRITALGSLQSSLFVLSTRGAYRVFGTGTTGAELTPLAFGVSNISKFGCANAASLVAIAGYIVYLSDYGVFQIADTQNTGAYATNEVSQKIRNLFDVRCISTPLEALPWLSWDSLKQELYVGLPTSSSTYTTNTLYVYSLQRDTWTKYTTPGDFQVFAGYQYMDNVSGTQFAMLCTTYRSGGVPSNLLFLKTNHNRFLDFCVKATGTGSSQDIKVSPVCQSVHTTTALLQKYAIPYYPLNFFTPQCFTVTLGADTLVYGTHFTVLPEGALWLTVSPPAGLTLTISVRRPVTEDIVGQTNYGVTAPIHIGTHILFQDNVCKYETVDYSNYQSAGISYVRGTFTSGSVLEVGQAYPSSYETPMFTKGELAKFKRVKHWLGLFSNKIAQETYSYTDVNAGSGQPVDELVGRPKNRMDMNVTFIYDSIRDGTVNYDLYGYNDLVWDDGYLDISGGESQQYYDSCTLKEAIQGMGATFQTILWSWDDSAFELAGFQIDSSIKGKRYTQHL